MDKAELLALAHEKFGATLSIRTDEIIPFEGELFFVFARIVGGEQTFSAIRLVEQAGEILTSVELVDAQNGALVEALEMALAGYSPPILGFDEIALKKVPIRLLPETLPIVQYLSTSVPLPAQEEEVKSGIVCERCGNHVQAYYSGSSKVSPADVAEATQTRWGIVACADCSEELVKEAFVSRGAKGTPVVEAEPEAELEVEQVA